jgi:hypothetical protein
MRRQLPSILPRAVLLLVALATSGCLDADSEWTLNPDGSGKVRQKLVFDPGPLKMLAPSARDFARDLIEGSEGIEVWKDISFGKRKDGKLHFSGVGYFKHASKVRLEKDLVETVFRREGESIVVEVSPRSPGEGLPLPGGGEDGKKLDVPSMRALLLLARGQIAGVKAFLKGRTLVRLPGKTTQSGFKETAQGLETHLLADRVLAALDALAKDEAKLRALVEKGAQKDAAANLLGEQPAARSTGGKPAFDYAAEVAAAKKAAPAAYASLGLPLLGHPGKLVSLSVGGVQYVHRQESDGMDLNFVMDFKPHAHVRLIAKLGELPLEVRGGRVRKILGADGTSLLIEDERKLEDINLDRRQSLVTFNLLSSLPKGEGGFKLVSGYLEYVLPGERKKVDLLLGGLKKGAKGQHYKAQITEVKPSKYHFGEGPRPMDVQLEISGLEKGELAGAEVRDAEGKALPTKITMTMPGLGSKLTLWLSVAIEKLPAKGTIALEIYSTRTRHRVPFKLENLDSSGRLGGKQ